MKSMWPPSVAIFFMTNFYRAGGGGGMAPSAPPGSAIVGKPMPLLFLRLNYQQPKDKTNCFVFIFSREGAAGNQ